MKQKRKGQGYDHKNKPFYTLSEPLDAMEMTIDGKYVITVSREGKISFYNSSLGVIERVFYREDDYPYYHDTFVKKHQMILSSDGSFVFILISPVDKIAIVDMVKKSVKKVSTKILKDYSIYELKLASAMIISPNNEFFLVAHRDKISICRVKKLDIISHVFWEKNSVNSLAFNLHGNNSPSPVGRNNMIE